jgi:hypothetical protein
MTTQASPPCSRVSRPGGNSGRASVVDVAGGVVVDVVDDEVVEDVLVEDVLVALTEVVVVDASAGGATVVSAEVPPPQAAASNPRQMTRAIVLMGKQHVCESARSISPCT